MSTERDELAERIAGRLLVDLGATTTDADAHDAAHNIAALLTEELGYRKPRQVSTVEELDALPEGSIVQGDWATYQLLLGSWATLSSPASVTPALPATVLYVGGSL